MPTSNHKNCTLQEIFIKFDNKNNLLLTPNSVVLMICPSHLFECNFLKQYTAIPYKTIS